MNLMLLPPPFDALSVAALLLLVRCLAAKIKLLVKQ